MNKKEQRRVVVLNRVVARELTAGEAAELLDLSVRQVRRLLASYRVEGVEALAHGNRGRQPVHTLDPVLRQRVVELGQGKYAGCNHQHLSELLEDEMTISRSSVRRILLGAGIGSPRKRRAPKHRRRRERYPQEGMLLQIDASPHDWLQGRGPRLTLIGAIDDATGKVPYALFRETEDGQGYFLLLRHIVGQQGRPLAVYHDRHSIFEHSSAQPMTVPEQLAGQREPTQFGRLLRELGIGSITARSPQAKGRIERLWGTFQDRLVSELRIAGVQTLTEANQVLGQFLVRFNRRFAVPAAQPGSAYQPVGADFAAERVFCFKYVRTVAADNTVRLGGRRLQLLGGRERISYAHARVEVQEGLDGSLAVMYQGRCVASQGAPLEAPALRARKGRGKLTEVPGAARQKNVAEGGVVGGEGDTGADRVTAPVSPSRHRPAADHPWRRYPTNQG